MRYLYPGHACLDAFADPALVFRVLRCVVWVGVAVFFCFVYCIIIYLLLMVLFYFCADIQQDAAEAGGGQGTAAKNKSFKRGVSKKFSRLHKAASKRIPGIQKTVSKAALIERINQPDCQEPWEVLMLNDMYEPIESYHKKYRRLSQKMHPDKNIGNAEAANTAFIKAKDAVDTAEKALALKTKIDELGANGKVEELRVFVQSQIWHPWLRFTAGQRQVLHDQQMELLKKLSTDVFDPVEFDKSYKTFKIMISLFYPGFYGRNTFDQSDVQEVKATLANQGWFEKIYQRKKVVEMMVHQLCKPEKETFYCGF